MKKNAWIVLLVLTNILTLIFLVKTSNAYMAEIAHSTAVENDCEMYKEKCMTYLKEIREYELSYGPIYDNPELKEK